MFDFVENNRGKCDMKGKIAITLMKYIRSMRY